MEQATYWGTKQNPLARQAALEAPRLQGKTLVRFGPQINELPPNTWGPQSLRGIPTRENYSPVAPAAWNNLQWRSGFSRRADGTPTNGVPQSSAEEMTSRITQRYVYSEGAGIETFLADYPEVAKILLAAIPRIEDLFGKGAIISLRVSSDQESDSTLSANIRTRLEVSEARAARKSFNTSWWMRQSDELPLTFNLEYV